MMSSKDGRGTVGWLDLTVENAEQIRDFYESVVGWSMSAVSQGDYDDYCAAAEVDGPPIAGICHARGPNASMPAQWLMYVSVADLEASLSACRKLGGQIVCPPRDMGDYGRMCVICDPAGAVVAIIEPPSD
jgi:predicted enzyme related to lactoylglutathione lyase